MGESVRRLIESSSSPRSSGKVALLSCGFGPVFGVRLGVTGSFLSGERSLYLSRSDLDGVVRACCGSCGKVRCRGGGGMVLRSFGSVVEAGGAGVEGDAPVCCSLLLLRRRVPEPERLPRRFRRDMAMVAVISSVGRWRKRAASEILWSRVPVLARTLRDTLCWL